MVKGKQQSNMQATESKFHSFRRSIKESNFLFSRHTSLLDSLRKVHSAIGTESTRPSATAPKKESGTGQAQYMNWGFARPTGTGTGVLPVTGVGKGEAKAAPVSGLTDYDRQPASDPSQSRRPHTASVSRPGAVVSKALPCCAVLCFSVLTLSPYLLKSFTLSLSVPSLSRATAGWRRPCSGWSARHDAL